MSAPSQASRLGSSGTEAASVGVVGGGEFGRSLALAVARSAGTVLHYSRAANPIVTSKLLAPRIDKSTGQVR